jgi:hypothetical protein
MDSYDYHHAGFATPSTPAIELEEILKQETAYGVDVSIKAQLVVSVFSL